MRRPCHAGATTSDSARSFNLSHAHAHQSSPWDLADDAAAEPCLLTILIPCLDEAETLGACIVKALAFLAEVGVSGEVLIADNGSVDGSQAIAAALGARLVEVAVRGYGGALAGGIEAARGRYVIMADADDSYDLRNLGAFLDALRGGADLVMGNRFRGGIAAGAMPLLHRYLGNPVLTTIGRLLFGAPVRDFHCGLRGFERERIRALGLRTTGMEFASEMVVRASLAGLDIREVPTTLSKDGRSRPPHLRTWRDGWRHLRFLLLHSPRWTFLYPGAAMALGGGALAAALLPGPLRFGPGFSVDIHTFLVACVAVLVGTQIVTFGMIARRYAAYQALLPHAGRYGRLLEHLSLEGMLLAALLLLAAGLGGLVWSVWAWGRTGFGELDGSLLMRPIILSTCAIATAAQIGFSAFLLGILDLARGDDARARQERLRQAFAGSEGP